MTILKKILNFIFNALLVGDMPKSKDKDSTYLAKGEYAQMSLDQDNFEEEI